MARKIDVIEADGRPGCQVKKCVARLLVKRLLAIPEPGKPFTIRKVAIRHQPQSLVREAPLNPSWIARTYQHHIEPKLIPSSFANSEWMRYLYGYS